MNKRATISDVAKLAGVSIATVSRVINHTGTVMPEYKIKVQRAVAELGYETNSLASSLKRGSSHVIGLIVPRLTNIFFMEVMEGLESVLNESGYSLVIAVSNNERDLEKKLIERISSQMVDGLIVATSAVDGNAFCKMKVPTILIDRRLSNARVDMVSDENYLSTYHLTQILIEEGHKNIGILHGFLENLPMMKERYQGCVDAMKDARIPFRESFVITGKNGHNATAQDIEKYLMRWKQENQMPTALVSLNGKQTEIALLVARSQNISIPEELSIVSFGQMSSPLIEPRITCVKQDGHRIGKKAGELLLGRLNKEQEWNVRQDIVYDCEIEMGDSVRKLN